MFGGGLGGCRKVCMKFSLCCFLVFCLILRMLLLEGLRLKVKSLVRLLCVFREWMVILGVFLKWWFFRLWLCGKKVLL